MRRPSYLARIVEDVKATRRQAVLTPPRLLFRPTFVALDFDVEAEATPVRANTQRVVDARRAKAAAPEPPLESHPPVRSRQRDAIGQPAAVTPRLRADRTALDLAAEPPAQRTTAAPRHPAADASRLASQAWRQGEPVRQAIAPDAGRKDLTPAEPTVRTAGPVAAREKRPSLPAPRRDLPPAPGARSSTFEANGRHARSAHLAIEPSARRPFLEPLQQAMPTMRVELVPPEPRASAPIREEPRMRGGRVHIGRLEVRVVPPAPAPRPPSAPPVPAQRAASPTVPSRPLARGFRVFGFSQG